MFRHSARSVSNRRVRASLGFARSFAARPGKNKKRHAELAERRCEFARCHAPAMHLHSLFGFGQSVTLFFYPEERLLAPSLRPAPCALPPRPASTPPRTSTRPPAPPGQANTCVSCYEGRSRAGSPPAPTPASRAPRGRFGSRADLLLAPALRRVAARSAARQNRRSTHAHSFGRCC